MAVKYINQFGICNHIIYREQPSQGVEKTESNFCFPHWSDPITSADEKASAMNSPARWDSCFGPREEGRLCREFLQVISARACSSRHSWPCIFKLPGRVFWLNHQQKHCDSGWHEAERDEREWHTSTKGGGSGFVFNSAADFGLE